MLILDKILLLWYKVNILDSPDGPIIELESPMSVINYFIKKGWEIFSYSETINSDVKDINSGRAMMTAPDIYRVLLTRIEKK